MGVVAAAQSTRATLLPRPGARHRRAAHSGAIKRTMGEEKISVNQTPKWKVIDPSGAKVNHMQPPAASNAKAGLQGRRAKASSGPKMDAGKVMIGGDSFVKRTKEPAWLNDRVKAYETIKAKRQAELEQKTPIDIHVTMPDGKVLHQDKEGNAFQAWKTSPHDVALTISQGLADAVTVARVTYESFAPDYSPWEDGMEGEDTLADAMADGGVEQAKDQKTMLWDMTRPLVGPVAKLEFLKFESDQDAKTVFWHSSAHMMGEALEHLFGCKLTIGPPLAGGFYYDSYMGSDAFNDNDCTYLIFCLAANSRSLHLTLSIHRCSRGSRSWKNYQTKAKV